MQQNATPARSRSARLEALCCRGTWTCPGCPHVPSAPFLLWAGPYPWGCVLGRTGVWICTSMRVSPRLENFQRRAGQPKVTPHWQRGITCSLLKIIIIKIPIYCCSSVSFSYRICVIAAQSYFSEIPRCSQTPAFMSGNSRRLKSWGSFTPLGLWLCGLAITRQL